MIENYYEMTYDYRNDKALYGEHFKISDGTVTQHNLMEGKVLGDCVLQVWLEDEEGEYVDLLDAGGNFLITEKLKNVILSFDLNIEVIQVLFMNAKIQKPYFFCNLLNNVDAFDWSKSIYKARTFKADNQVDVWDNTTFDPGKLSDLVRLKKTEKAVFRDEKIGDRHLFQVKYLEVHKFVSRELKEAIEAAGITGVKFIPLSEFTSGF